MKSVEWARALAEKIKEKEAIVAKRNRGKIPYTTVDGHFDDKLKDHVSWWTNGFWGGMMWQLYQGTGTALFKEMAEENEAQLDAVLMDAMGLDHDNGFKWLPTSVANYRLTGNEASKNRAILAANNLLGRYNLAGSFIRAWNDWGDGGCMGWAIIDCMMNLPLLYWATEETKDPRFKQVAMSHADTAIKHFIREDGSSKHIVEFDPKTGDYVKSYGGQGYADGSSWTRGQAWALYGFTLSYIHTKEERYLATAKKVAEYFMSQIPGSGLIPVDFCQPETCGLEDSTASAIAACGLIELSKIMDQEGQDIYMAGALKLLKALGEKRCNLDHDVDHLLEKCTAAYHDQAHEFAIIYGDYYFIEAIWKLTGQELFIW